MIPLCYSSLRNRHIQVGNGSCISPWELVGDSLRVRGEISLIPYIRLYIYILYQWYDSRSCLSHLYDTLSFSLSPLLGLIIYALRERERERFLPHPLSRCLLPMLFTFSVNLIKEIEFNTVILFMIKYSKFYIRFLSMWYYILFYLFFHLIFWISHTVAPIIEKKVCITPF